MERYTKTCVRYNERGHAHALTFSCADRKPLLASPAACQLVVEALSAARAKQEFDVWACVVMPEHAHILIWPRKPDYSISAILFAIKRPVAFWARRHGLNQDGHFWLPGGGFDRNVVSARAVHEEIEYMQGNPVRRKLCERPEDWRYSSARFWAGGTDVPLAMDKTVPAKDL